VGVPLGARGDVGAEQVGVKFRAPAHSDGTTGAGGSPGSRPGRCRAVI
jgi:hypothetical protein